MKKPIVLVIMDGVGKGDGGSGDAVKVANTPVLDKLLAECPHTPALTANTVGSLPNSPPVNSIPPAIFLSLRVSH